VFAQSAGTQRPGGDVHQACGITKDGARQSRAREGELLGLDLTMPFGPTVMEANGSDLVIWQRVKRNLCRRCQAPRGVHQGKGVADALTRAPPNGNYANRGRCLAKAVSQRSNENSRGCVDPARIAVHHPCRQTHSHYPERNGRRRFRGSQRKARHTQAVGYGVSDPSAPWLRYVKFRKS